MGLDSHEQILNSGTCICRKKMLWFDFIFKAKLKVYESHWSHAFSMDTVGNCGVVECHDNQRRQKYTVSI